jgi:heme/copper-type cytochrome/quinol oxidase subunit 4
MSIKIFLISIMLPIIFLMVATAHQGDKFIKWLFIIFAFLSLAFIGGCLYLLHAFGKTAGENNAFNLFFPFIIAVVAISTWAVSLVVWGGRDNGKHSDNE